MWGEFQLLAISIKNIVQDNCPAGCPCDSYECEYEEEPKVKEAVLMLSTYAKSQNKPMVIGFNGK